MQNDGGHRRQPTYAGLRRYAGDLLGRTVRPGHDYAITEVVHCKSRKEADASGTNVVLNAARCCAPRFLDDVLHLAAADVIVAFGRQARQPLPEHLGVKARYCDRLWPAVPIAGRPRLVAHLDHPARHGALPSVAEQLGAAGVAAVRAALGSPNPCAAGSAETPPQPSDPSAGWG